VGLIEFPASSIYTREDQKNLQPRNQRGGEIVFKAQCCPKTPFRRIPRSIYEEARDVARALAKTEAFERSRRDRKRIEMAVCTPQAHPTTSAVGDAPERATKLEWITLLLVVFLVLAAIIWLWRM